MTPSYSDEYTTTYPDGFRAGRPVTKKYQEKRVMHPFVQASVTPQRYLSRIDTFRSDVAGQPAPGQEAPIWANQIYTDEKNACLIKAYDKLKGSISRAELGVGIAEASESISLVNGRCVQLARAAVALRKGRLSDVKRILREGVPTPRKGFPPDTKVKKLLAAGRPMASIWLEYWMGWAPLIGDIYASLEVATGPMPPVLIRGSSGYQKTYKGSSGLPRELRSWDMDAFIRVGLQADVEITNPNLALLNQFGLANPVSIALAVVPFSFMLEWFVNLNQVVSSYTDFLGFGLSNQQTTVKYGAEGKASYIIYGTPYYSGVAKHVTFTRTLDITTPKLGFRRVNGLSTTRGATALSLLVSILKH